MSKEAMQIALDALEANLGNWAAKTKAVEVLRQALVDADDTSQKRVDEKAKREHEWVGLTDDAVFELADTNLYDGGKNYGVLAFAKAVEQALKEKNHG